VKEPGVPYMWSLSSGPDAPLTRKARLVYRSILYGVATVGVVLIGYLRFLR
jgi:hypothetical protein